MRYITADSENMTKVLKPLFDFRPRLLNQLNAAGFLGISERAFETRWRNSTFPTPIKIGRRLLWDRKILERCADELSEFNEPHAEPAKIPF